MTFMPRCHMASFVLFIVVSCHRTLPRLPAVLCLALSHRTSCARHEPRCRPVSDCARAKRLSVSHDETATVRSRESKSTRTVQKRERTAFTYIPNMLCAKCSFLRLLRNAAYVLRYAYVNCTVHHSLLPDLEQQSLLAILEPRGEACGSKQ